MVNYFKFFFFSDFVHLLIGRWISIFPFVCLKILLMYRKKNFQNTFLKLYVFFKINNRYCIIIWTNNIIKYSSYILVFTISCKFFYPKIYCKSKFEVMNEKKNPMTNSQPSQKSINRNTNSKQSNADNQIDIGR